MSRIQPFRIEESALSKIRYQSFRIKKSTLKKMNCQSFRIDGVPQWFLRTYSFENMFFFRLVLRSGFIDIPAMNLMVNYWY